MDAVIGERSRPVVKDWNALRFIILQDVQCLVSDALEVRGSVGVVVRVPLVGVA